MFEFKVSAANGLYSISSEQTYSICNAKAHQEVEH